MTDESLPAPTTDVALQFASYFPNCVQPCFYLLWQRLQEGHICVPKSELSGETIREVFPEFSGKDVNLKDFISDGSDVKPVIEYNGRLYLQRYFQYETTVVNKIKKLVSESSVIPHFKEAITVGQEPDWQKVAVAACLMSNFTIITGGPGTGKTTTVAAILNLLLTQNPKYKVALAAPTGKAAARMAESLKEHAERFPKVKDLFLKMEPYTIHRLLGSVKKSIHFKHDSKNPLDEDIIIIDESSMIDIALFAKLLDAVKEGTRLILLGDKNQLASVEAGSLFGDLCSVPEKLNSFSKNFIASVQDRPRNSSSLPITDTPSFLSDHIVELQKSYRFSADKGIGRLSRIVINEDTAALEAFLGSKDDVVEIDLQYKEELFKNFALKFGDYLKEKDISAALKKMNEHRVLCALREGYFGLYEINRRIENILEGKGFIKRTNEFYNNRPIIITKNNYALGLFNGDTGIVRKDDGGNLKVWFEINGELTGFAPALIGNTDTAFALTIHKSQGSEFSDILMILPDYEAPVLTKELVYTGITRAKNYVLLQTDETILKNTIQRSVKRGSGLKERF